MPEGMRIQLLVVSIHMVSVSVSEKLTMSEANKVPYGSIICSISETDKRKSIFRLAGVAKDQA